MKKIFVSMMLLCSVLISNAFSDDLEYLLNYNNGLCEKLSYKEKLDIIKLLELKQVIIADKGRIGNTTITYTKLILDTGTVSYTSNSYDGCKAIYNYIKPQH